MAEAALYPTIAINGLIGWDAADFTKLFETRSFIGAVFPSFAWNILNYGRIRNNVQLQVAKLQELIATYQNQVLTAGREVQIPMRGFLKSRQQTEDLDRAVKAATAATGLGVQQYRTGIIDFNRVFNLETTQVQQQDQLAVAAGNIALNLVDVYRAFGGGWELRCQQEELRHQADQAHADGPAPARCRLRRLPSPVCSQPHCPRRGSFPSSRSASRARPDSRRSDMRSELAKWTVVLTVFSLGHAFAGEPGSGDEPSHHRLFERLRPAGGWHPYGGGLVHWWKVDCFPCQVGPDDYCRKPLPRMCWPSYPPFYTWGPPEIGHPLVGSAKMSLRRADVERGLARQ